LVLPVVVGLLALGACSLKKELGPKKADEVVTAARRVGDAGVALAPGHGHVIRLGIELVLGLLGLTAVGDAARTRRTAGRVIRAIRDVDGAPAGEIQPPNKALFASRIGTAGAAMIAKAIQ